jgi:predicted acylesterase/phospholipase RssA
VNIGFAVKMSAAAVLGVFKFVEYKQRYLVAGGLAEDILVNIAKIFDADIIIAVSAVTNITKNNVNNVFATLYAGKYIFKEEFWIRVICYDRRHNKYLCRRSIGN